MPRLAACAIGLVAIALAAAPRADAQAFGKNKVQYEPLDWAVFETAHLRLHYHSEEDSLARRLTAFAESVCVEFDARFNLEPRNKVPFLLYAAHHLFQQTNATSGFISEGTGGLTELIKGRVLLPHTGSWHQLEWVTRHELTHWYMLEKLTRVMREHRKSQSYMPPLWFIEGLAEFCATEWNEDAEGLLRDAVLNGQALPLTKSDPILGTVLMYKEGHSFLLYLADRFGRESVFRLLENWYKAEDFERVFRITYDLPLEQVDEEWFASLKRRYYPLVADRQAVHERARMLTRRGPFNMGGRALPAAAHHPDSVRFCYFAATEGAVDLMVSEVRPNGRRHDRRLLRGGLSPSFESFHLFQNRPDASASGLIALSAKRGGRDALYVIDSRTGRVLRKLEFPSLVAINDPSLAPGDQAVVFSAQDLSGRSDLYRALWTKTTVRLERLTNDDYDDLDPDVSPDGRWVAFASDRGERGGSYGLFRISLQGGSPEPVSDPAEGDDRQPVYSPDGKWIAFRSTRDGTSDLYVRPAEPARSVRRVTRLLGPAYDPDWLPGGKGLMFTGQHAVRFQSYALAFDPETLAVEEETPPAARVPAVAARVHEEPPGRYARRLGFDLVQNGISFDPGLGSRGGGGQIALSDVLGNEQVYLFLANDADRFGDFWDGFEGGLTYINRARRLNWGVGIFRLTEIYDADLDLIRREKRVGMLGLASYPFNKFTRIEGSVLARHASDHLLRSGDFKDLDLISNYLALVHDDARWTALGPSGGRRLFLSAGFTRDLTTGKGDYATVMAESRHYAQPIPQIVLAARAQGQASVWRDAQRFYLGGRTSLRGWDYRDLAGLKTVLLQQEVRFPLVRGLTFAVPTAWSFPTIHGALFADAAWAWDEGPATHLGSLGVGVYVGGGYFPAIRWNYAWPTVDFKTYPRRPRTQFSIGYNF